MQLVSVRERSVCARKLGVACSAGESRLSSVCCGLSACRVVLSRPNCSVLFARVDTSVLRRSTRCYDSFLNTPDLTLGYAYVLCVLQVVNPLVSKETSIYCYIHMSHKTPRPPT
eukprot:8776115-Pyramimonas_sp.AAC.1